MKRKRVKIIKRQDRLRVHFGSQTDLWSTPIDLFRKYDAEFQFEIDVCAVASNAKCKAFYSPEQDGLRQEWKGRVWMNPPYGRAIGNWVRKAYDSSRVGATVVALVPARTDTRWWHKFVTRADEVRLLRGRLKFGNAKSSAPFPSAIVIFRPPMPSKATPNNQIPLFPMTGALNAAT